MDSENLNSHPDVSPMNNFVVLLMKKCNTFLSHADVQLGTKFYDLNVLCSIWKAKTNKGKLVVARRVKISNRLFVFR